jgi:hypothetical protein
MKIIQFTVCFLLAMFLCGFGCSSPKPTPDPLAGWQLDFSPPGPGDKIIEKDYQDYIQKLPAKDKNYVGPIFYYKDGTGQHAVGMEIFVKGENASWHYLLIYDKENKRIKAIRYGYGSYQS